MSGGKAGWGNRSEGERTAGIRADRRENGEVGKEEERANGGDGQQREYKLSGAKAQRSGNEGSGAETEN